MSRYFSPSVEDMKLTPPADSSSSLLDKIHSMESINSGSVMIAGIKLERKKNESKICDSSKSGIKMEKVVSQPTLSQFKGHQIRRTASCVSIDRRILKDLVGLHSNYRVALD